MTISTSLFYDRARSHMTGLSARADTLNTQIATGKKLAAPSDDPIAYGRLRGLSTQAADAGAYDGNLKVASSVLASADTALTSIQAQIQRASELAVQANNGTLSADNRKAIGEELSGIVDTLAGLANGKDSRGLPLFGDANGGQAVTATSSSSWTFAASGPSAVPIADGQSIQPSTTAAKIFQFGSTDTLSVIHALSTTLLSGGAIGSAASSAITDLQTATDQVASVQASIGARAARVELEQSDSTAVATRREADRSALEDADVTTSITELQKTMTVLQATQASFSKLSSLSLFDYLR